jgi:GH25 family lysozyme M1 (1,4-beta-N-acetylmuramidase)
MGELLIADVSEHQGTINWSAHVASGQEAVIIRAHNGSRADNYWPGNRDRFQAAGGRITGIYQYLLSGRDAAQQARDFCTLVGPLRPGEFAALDLEDGDGDQSARARQWRQIVTNQLGTNPWIYASQYYFRDHSLGNAGFDTQRTWIAAYGPNRPPWPSHSMWQFSETYGPMAGISARHDCSKFFGTIDDLTDLVGSAGAVQHRPAGTPVPFPGRDKFGPGADNQYVNMLGQWLVAKGYGAAYQVGPSPRWGTADQQATRQFQLAQGWTGSDADGFPGPETWRRLQL